jgi:hypothetical protein
MLKIHNRDSKSMALFKADIQKTFDTISWKFIIEMLKLRSFTEDWKKWIQNSILGGTS